MAEKRSVKRFELDLKAFVSESDNVNESEAFVMQTRDVSSNGVYLFTGKALAVGTRVKVEMILALDELKKLGGKALIKTSGKVLRRESHGMAICFDGQSRIVPYLRKNNEIAWNL
jgi:hypothetical protein